METECENDDKRFLKQTQQQKPKANELSQKFSTLSNSDTWMKRSSSRIRRDFVQRKVRNIPALLWGWKGATLIHDGSTWTHICLGGSGAPPGWAMSLGSVVISTEQLVGFLVWHEERWLSEIAVKPVITITGLLQFLVLSLFFSELVFFYYRWGQENLLLSSFQWFSKLSFPAVSRLLWHAQVWDEGTMETHGKCNKLVQGKMLKFRILASPKQPFPLSVTFALVVGVDALLYLRGQLILLTGEPVFPSWCNPFYMNLSSGGVRMAITSRPRELQH